MRICMYGFSGQNTNLWLKYFRDHTDHQITFFTPSFHPGREYAFSRLKVIEIEKNGSRAAGSIFHRYIRIRTACYLRRNRFDLVIMQGLYNRSFAPFMFLRSRANTKIVTVWNDLNYRNIAADRDNPANASILEALTAADLILPTWQPTRDGFAAEFPELAAKTVVKSWGTDTEMVTGTTGEAELPELLAKAVKHDAPLMFWPRTVRKGIRHDLLLEALILLDQRSVDMVSILAMGNTGKGDWENKVLALLEAAGRNGFVAADHSRHIPLKDLYGIYRKADLMVNLADSDQVSTCVVEAFLFGLDVILSDIPPYRALREMGLSVKLVPHDPVIIAQAIEESIKSVNSDISLKQRQRNREIAKKLFDLKTNLESLISFAVNHTAEARRSVLFLAPGSPPFGGVANQSALLMHSPAIAQEFRISPMRTNPRRKTENPSRRSAVSLSSFLKLLLKALTGRVTPKPDVIQLVANGDVSFIRDMVIAYTLKMRFRVPLAVHLHGSRKGFWHNRSADSSTATASNRPTVFEKAGYLICRLFLKSADSLSQLTSEIDFYYRSIGFPAADMIIPNGAAKRPNLFAPGQPGNILFVGRLSREKGFFDLLNALRAMKTGGWQLNVLGEFPSESEREAAAEILLSHPWTHSIFLHGSVTGEEKWEFFRNASVFVLPTYIDVFPVVILEAMAFGCAIVTTEVGEIGGIDGSEYFDFVKPGDVDSLWNTVSGLVANRDACVEKGILNHKSSAGYTIDRTASMLRANLEAVSLSTGGDNG